MMTWGEPRREPREAVWLLVIVALMLALTGAYDLGYSHGLDVGVMQAGDRAYHTLTGDNR